MHAIKNIRSLVGMVALSGTLASLGCTGGFNSLGGSAGSATSASSVQQSSVYDVNRYAVNKTACNPLSGGTAPTDPTQGVHATLSYLTAAQPRYTTVSDMMANGTVSPHDLFFADINVPTRTFSTGFPLQTGGLIQDDQGNNLFEYFALRLESQVHLGPSDPAGDYQFALLADDGAIMSFSNNNDNVFTAAVNDDGLHPTQLGCGSTISMDSSTNLNMRLDYFQGPRYEIALVPLWRTVNSSTAADPLCGTNGDHTWFDPDHSSNPLTDYMQLLARGWHPLTAANYSIPGSAGYNPCVTGTPPAITNVAVVNNLEEGYYLVTWTTDAPATDQVLVTDLSTNVQTLTVSDNILRTQHSVQVRNLMFVGHNYTVQAVSIAADLGKTISPAIQVTVP